MFPLFKYLNQTNINNILYSLKTYGPITTFHKITNNLSLASDYRKFLERTSVSSSDILEQSNFSFAFQPLISIVVPLYNTPLSFLKQMIDSVISQSYTNWELCLADGSPSDSDSKIFNVIKNYQQNFSNIKYQKLEKNLGISGNTNAALSLASGDFIALLDHDDLLTPDALFEIVTVLNKHNDVDVLYTDEDKVDTDLSNYYDPYFKPDFNLDLLRTCNYITHFFVVKKNLALSVGGFSDECNGSQDYDFILKNCEKAQHIYHIPKILYHWRIHPASVAGDPKSKTYAYDSAVRALQNHLQRCNISATVKKSDHFGYYQIHYHCSNTPLVSIYLKDCSSNLLKQLKAITTYKNYEFVTNPLDATGAFLIQLYNIDSILSPDWIEQLLGNCCRSSIGMAGTKILYKNTILESGLIFTQDGNVHSPFRSLPKKDPGYCYRAQVQQQCSLISPSCYMISTKLYKNLYASIISDSFIADHYQLCKKIGDIGKAIIVLPQVSVLSSTKNVIYPKLEYYSGKTDPFYNPNFSTKTFYRLPR